MRVPCYEVCTTPHFRFSGCLLPEMCLPKNFVLVRVPNPASGGSTTSNFLDLMMCFHPAPISPIKRGSWQFSGHDYWLTATSSACIPTRAMFRVTVIYGAETSITGMEVGLDLKVVLGNATRVNTQISYVICAERQ